MKSEDIANLPTRETDDVTMLGDITDVVYLCRTLEQRLAAAVMALEEVKQDLKDRADPHGVVSVGNGVWTRLCETIAAIKEHK